MCHGPDTHFAGLLHECRRLDHAVRTDTQRVQIAPKHIALDQILQGPLEQIRSGIHHVVTDGAELLASSLNGHRFLGGNTTRVDGYRVDVAPVLFPEERHTERRIETATEGDDNGHDLSWIEPESFPTVGVTAFSERPGIKKASLPYGPTLSNMRWLAEHLHDRRKRTASESGYRSESSGRTAQFCRVIDLFHVPRRYDRTRLRIKHPHMLHGIHDDAKRSFGTFFQSFRSISLVFWRDFRPADVTA